MEKQLLVLDKEIELLIKDNSVKGIMLIGIESHLENFREFLRNSRLAPLFEREDYKELLTL